MLKTCLYRIFLIFVTVLFSFQVVQAQELEKKYNDWSVYTADKDGGKLCYIVSYPTKESGNYSYRDTPYVMVTNVNGEREEFSVTSGYKYKQRTEPRVIIGKKEYRLSVTQDEYAWFKTSKFDKLAIDTMKKGIRMKIKGTSVKGTYSIDSYSLRGFTKAYQAMNQLCS